MAMMLSCMLLVGCKPATQCNGDQCLSLDVEVDGIPALDISSRADGADIIKPESITGPAVAGVYVKAFNSSGIQIGAIKSLTKDSKDHIWKGHLTLTNPTGTVTFLAYALAADGKYLYSGTHPITDIEEKSDIPFTITVQGDESGTSGTPAYQVGDMGPGGGLVFYDAGNYNAGWRYMEVAPVTWNGGGADPQAVWGAKPSTVGLTGNTFRAIGKGKSNTATLATFNNNYPLTGTAAQLCKNLNFNGYSDWFLPSDYELSEIDGALVYTAAHIQAQMYWSSAEGNNNLSRVYDFKDLGDTTADKNAAYYVRPARQF